MFPSSPRPLTRPLTRGGRYGFSLIELLVVLAILAVLFAMITAAVQSARGTARRLQCAANLRNLAQGALTHNTHYAHLPTGGWGWSWIGDPDAGHGQNQPGGWCYNILPFVDQRNVHDLGFTGTPAAASWNKPQKFAGNQARAQAPVRGFNCPTRRDSVPFARGYSYINAPTIASASRTDYACNVGDQGLDEYFPGPGDYATGLNPAYWTPTGGCGHDASVLDGVIFERSLISLADITRGGSNVYLIGEKYLNPDNYLTGTDGGDNECMEIGMDNDICRTTAYAPMRDKAGTNDTLRFGSAHPIGFNMAFCDGSVRFIAYNVSPAVHKAAGSRR